MGRDIEILFPVSILSFSSLLASDSTPAYQILRNWTISDRVMTLCRLSKMAAILSQIYSQFPVCDVSELRT